MPAGRPSAIAPEITTRIIDLVKAGNYVEVAARAAGISRQTLLAWMDRGRREKTGRYHEFLVTVSKAMAESESIDVLRIGATAGKGAWMASAWRLERKNPNRWGPRIQVTVRQELESCLDHLEKNLPADLYERVLAIAASYNAGDGEIGLKDIGVKALQAPADVTINPEDPEP